MYATQHKCTLNLLDPKKNITCASLLELELESERHKMPGTVFYLPSPLSSSPADDEISYKVRSLDDLLAYNAQFVCCIW
jgi:hypothetical protein